MKIVVDADACPRGAMEAIRRLQPQFGYGVLTVASFNHALESWGPGHEHVVVGAESQATDIAVANRTQRGDIVVTQDWGLAALALGRGAQAIGPDGRIYQPDRIEHLLEERALKARFRRGGGRTKGPAARNSADDKNFEDNLRLLLEQGTGPQLDPEVCHDGGKDS